MMQEMFLSSARPFYHSADILELITEINKTFSVTDKLFAM